MFGTDSGGATTELDLVRLFRTLLLLMSCRTSFICGAVVVERAELGTLASRNVAFIGDADDLGDRGTRFLLRIGISKDVI